MKTAITFMIVALLAGAGQPAGRAPGGKPGGFGTDPRLDRPANLSGGKPLPMAQALIACAREADVDLLAAGADLIRPPTPARTWPLRRTLHGKAGKRLTYADGLPEERFNELGRRVFSISPAGLKRREAAQTKNGPKAKPQDRP
jgi:hypothetical protein